MKVNTIINGDALIELKKFPDECIDTVITSPPYYSVRDYKIDNQIGLEDHPKEYINKIVEIVKECKRVLKPTGSIFLNLGDSFYTKSGSGQGNNFLKRHQQLDGGDGVLTKCHTQIRGKYKTNWLQSKQKLLIPYRIAIKCQDELGLILRNDINWIKQWTNWKTKESAGSSMPTSVKDRLNTNSESIFFFVKQKKYFFDLNSIRVLHKENSIKRYKRGISDNHKYTYGSPGQLVQGLFRQRLNQTKIPKKQAELFGSPRARIYRNKTKNEDYKKGMKNAPEPNEPNAFNPLGKNPGDCLMFPVEPSKEKHYAMFPKTLPDFFIRVGCPRYVCSKCGKPREKIYEVVGHQITDFIKIDGGDKNGKYYGSEQKDYESSKTQKPSETKKRIFKSMSEIKDYKYSDCHCGAKFKPGIVLDPFLGAGTTAVVAKKLGRNFIGIELNPDYIEIAKKRLANIEKPLDNYESN